MSYANITNPANFQLQDFAQFGFRVITTDFIPVPGEQYRTLYVLQDAVVTATTQKGDDITSKAILAGTLLHGLFNSVSITSGRVLAYAAGRVTADEIIALYEAYVVALGGTLENTQCAIDTLNDTGVDFFADASLVMIPEGYGTGVVYGQRPLTSDSQLTFTRASTATRVGPDGLIEKVRTNVVLQSNTFTTSWGSSGTTLTSGQTGYDGLSDAWLLSKDAAANRYIFQSLSVSEIKTFSVYAKANTLNNVRLYSTTGTSSTADFSLVDGSLLASVSILGSSSEDLGNGWWRFSITTDGTSSLFRIYPDPNGTTAGSIYFQNAQLETGDIATPYIPTTTTAVSVGPVANLPRIDYTGGGCGKLLLEPQRTNLALYSEQFDNAAWTKTDATINANAVVSPDGYQNADIIIEDATNNRHRIFRANSKSTVATTYTFSIYIKNYSGRTT
jgi:hypothetical protein